MKIVVDQELCIGCGLCVQVAPEVYEMKGDKAVLIAGDVSSEKSEDAKNAAEQCPVSAIVIS